MAIITFESVLQDYRKRYGNTSFINLNQAAIEINVAHQTARNLVSKGRFPVPTHKVGNKRQVSLYDLASYVLDPQCFAHLLEPVKKPTGSGRGRGRPRKSAQ